MFRAAMPRPARSLRGAADVGPYARCGASQPRALSLRDRGMAPRRAGQHGSCAKKLSNPTLEQRGQGTLDRVGARLLAELWCTLVPEPSCSLVPNLYLGPTLV